MAGTLVTDRIESDASYASSITVASPLVVSNTINMTGGSFTGNVNINSGTLFLNQNNSGGIPALNLIQDESTIQGPYANTAIRMGGNLVLRAAVQVNIDTGGVGRVVIDSSGRVTKPYQPAFRARNASQQTITNDAADIKVDYGTITTNIGSNYNNATSRFTAPVAGWYHFNAFFMLNSFPTNWDYCFIRFLLNGSSSNSELMYGRVTSGSLFITLAGSTYLYLSANDYVEVFTRLVGGSSNATIRNDFAEFQGMLVC